MFCHNCLLDYQSRRGFRRHKSLFPKHKFCDYEAEPLFDYKPICDSNQKFYKHALKRTHSECDWDHFVCLDNVISSDDWRSVYMNRADASIWFVHRESRGPVVWERHVGKLSVFCVDRKRMRKDLNLNEHQISQIIEFSLK